MRPDPISPDDFAVYAKSKFTPRLRRVVNDFPNLISKKFYVGTIFLI
jgi:hypothetical protein